MLKRILLVFALSCPAAYAADTRPNEASIKQLLEVAQAHKLVDSMMAQMDAFVKNAMQQATQGQSVSPQIQKNIDNPSLPAVVQPRRGQRPGSILQNPNGSGSD